MVYGGLGPGPMPGSVLGEYGRAQAQGAAAEHHVPSPEVRRLDDERLRRRLRRRLSFWRLFRRVR